MSHFLCPKCSHREYIFGKGGARQTAEKMGLPFLGEVPIETLIRETSGMLTAFSHGLFDKEGRSV